MTKFNARGGDASQYNLGRGKLYLKGETKFLSATPVLDGWRDIGNVTQFTVTQEAETKEHKSFLTGVQSIDQEIAVSRKMNISFATDELSANNIALFLSGTLRDNAQGDAVANGACLASDFDAGGGIALTNKNFFYDSGATDFLFDIWFDLTLELNVPGVLAYGVTRCYDFQPQGTQAIAVRKDGTTRTDEGGGTTLLTEGTHYEIDRKMGRIRFFNVGSGGLERGDTFMVKWAAPAGDATKSNGIDFLLTKVGLLTSSGVSVGLKFVGENPNDPGRPMEMEFYSIKLRPDGDFAGIGDDWTQLAFSGVAQAVSNPPLFASPYGVFTSRPVYST